MTTDTTQPVKRGRGRPRGSTKQPAELTLFHGSLPPNLRRAEVKAYLRLSDSTIQLLDKKGEIESWLSGRRRLYVTASILAYEERQKAAEAARRAARPPPKTYPNLKRGKAALPGGDR